MFDHQTEKSVTLDVLSGYGRITPALNALLTGISATTSAQLPHLSARLSTHQMEPVLHATKDTQSATESAFSMNLTSVK